MRGWRVVVASVVPDLLARIEAVVVRECGSGASNCVTALRSWAPMTAASGLLAKTCSGTGGVCLMRRMM